MPRGRPGIQPLAIQAPMVMASRAGDDTRDDGPVAESGKGHGDGDDGGDDFAADLDGRQRGIAQMPLQKSEMLNAGGIDDEGRRERNDDQGRSRSW